MVIFSTKYASVFAHLVNGIYRFFNNTAKLSSKEYPTVLTVWCNSFLFQM